MTLNELLQIAEEREIELVPDGDLLRYRASEGALDDDFLQELRRHKHEILAALQRPATVYYVDDHERWFKDAAGKFWFEDRATGQLTELVPGNPPEGEPLPPAFFQAFSGLLGRVVKGRVQ